MSRGGYWRTSFHDGDDDDENLEFPITSTQSTDEETDDDAIVNSFFTITNNEWPVFSNLNIAQWTAYVRKHSSS